YGVVVFFFFFQAEDGIRDFHVTGVQTCALPILISRAGSVRAVISVGMGQTEVVVIGTPVSADQCSDRYRYSAGACVTAQIFLRPGSKPRCQPTKCGRVGNISRAAQRCIWRERALKTPLTMKPRAASRPRQYLDLNMAAPRNAPRRRWRWFALAGVLLLAAVVGLLISHQPPEPPAAPAPTPQISTPTRPAPTGAAGGYCAHTPDIDAGKTGTAGDRRVCRQ